jgi:signal transduction histidine kinase
MALKYKFPVVLTLLIIIPIILLGWLGARLQSSEKIIVEHQFQQLADSRLREAEQIIVSYLNETENELVATLNSFNEDRTLGTARVEGLRTLVRRTSLFDSLFMLDANGVRLFPPQDQQASDIERKFVEQTKWLWLSPDAFSASSQQEGREVELEMERPKNQKNIQHLRHTLYGKVRSFSRRDGRLEASNIAQALGPDADYGWTIWNDVGKTTQTFFWLRDARQNLIAVEVSQSKWTSDLIGRLPDARTAGRLLGGDRIKFLNWKQDLIYQWGAVEDKLFEGAHARTQIEMEWPLLRWRLEYYSPQNQSGRDLRWLFYLLLFLAIGLVLIGLGKYLLQQYRREINLADQRVTFVNRVSHELKTPLTNICMYADLMESQVANGDLTDYRLAQKYSKVLSMEAQRLGRLINNVLSFSSSREKERCLSFKAGIVDDTIHKTVQMFKPAFAAKEIEIELDLNATKQVLFDPDALEQIIDNLLGNIEKYAYGGKRARILSKQQGDFTIIIVEDAGPGIGPKTAMRLFEPFARGSSKLTEGVSGTGIGLTIARELANLHGGRLCLVKADRGCGARFEVTLQTSEGSIVE